MATETRLTLIRHGESMAQVRRQVVDHDSCEGLSELGRRQAAALRDRLLDSGELADATAIYTSILSRAIETASIISPGLRDVEPTRECNWCEIHAGEAEGMSWDDVVAWWESDPTRTGDLEIPGAESWDEFHGRVGPRLHQVAADHPDEHVVVVCHGGVIGASFRALGEFSKDRAPAAHEAINTSMTDWMWDGSGWRLVRYNDAAHLNGVS